MVPANERLLTKLTIIKEVKNIQEDDLMGYIKQKPNRKILGIFRFHLSVYNFAHTGKERKWKNRLGDIVGEEPVVFDPFMTQRSCEQISRFLINKGYPDARVTFDTIPKKKKKMEIKYLISEGNPLLIEKVFYQINDEKVQQYILEDTVNSLLKPNSIFDIELVQNERVRITQMLKNKGYFFFTRDDIVYTADTTQIKDKAILTAKIFDNKDTTYAARNPYELNSINFFVGFDPKKALETGNEYFSRFSVTDYKGYRFFHEGKLMYHPKVLLRAISIEPGQTYMQKYVNSSYRGLTSLKTFRLVNIQFSDTGYNVTRENRMLDAFILLTPLPRQSYQIEAVGTHSSGNLGVGGNLLYQNRNTFRSAEILDIKLHGAIERQTVVIEENDEQIQEFLPFNSMEIGGESSLFFHTFLFPFTPEKFNIEHHPKTSLTIAYNFQQRPDFSRTISNMTFGYVWEGKNAKSKHSVNPIEINFVQLPYISKKFRNSIRGTFLENSYTDHMVALGSYTYIISDLHPFGSRDVIFFRSTIESAGNLLNAIAPHIALNMNEDSNYTILKSPFAQFIKFESDFRYFKSLWFKQKLVYRFFAGAGYPYGNMKVLPFEKRYYCGGANSIRAWQVRSLGPGAFGSQGMRYANQTGDIKLEANLEYRFKLFWMIEGALFADAGNIWDIYKQEGRENGVFIPSQFYKDIAIGTGIGLRFDFSFFIFRLDWGLKVRDPSMPEGSRIIINDGKLSKSDHAFNIGIGYPF